MNDIHAIKYYIDMSYEVDKHDLTGLSLEELIYLTKLYSYRISILLKYGNTDKDFPGRLPITRHRDCYRCPKDIEWCDKYETIGYLNEKVEFVCKNCYEKENKK